MRLTLGLQQRIIEFLSSVPRMDDENMRRAVIAGAGLDPPVQQMIVFHEPSISFFSALVSISVKYGRLEDGRYALEAILCASKAYIGRDRQELCDRLILEFHAIQYPESSRMQMFYEKHHKLLSVISALHISDDEFIALYKASVPQYFLERFEFKVETRWKTLQTLWEIPLQPDQKFPVFDFLERLARHRHNQRIEHILRNFIKEFAPRPYVQELETKECSIGEFPPCLLVEILKEDEDDFRVEISLWNSPDDNEYIFMDDTSRSFESIPSLIVQVLSSIASKIPHKLPELMIEFFLPRELLSHDIDQWNMEDEFIDELTLGSEHRVIVRSQERVSNPRLQGHWRKKWKEFQGRIQSDCFHGSIEIICQEKHYAKGELYKQLVNCACTSCLGFLFMLKDTSSDERPLTEMLRAGIPVALWPRPCDGSSEYLSDIREKIKRLLLDSNPSELPERVKSERLDAIDCDEPHIGHYLTLLWDDPDRLPMKYDPQINTQLQAPA